MSQSTCKVFDFSGYVKQHIGENYKCLNKYALIVNGNKAIFADNDAVHWIKDLDESIEIPLYKCGDRTMEILPSKVINPTAKKLLDNIEHFIVEEMPLTKFVRHWNSRLESNYRILLKSIKEIGLDPENYPRDAAENARAH
jgi:hypothetical protein